ncbi:polysaccharide biosynthesis protein [Saccharopolyspora mangrovi]|uniref:Polysaccharide biosynthesis protein n=1 Tax=Saccharopolyspora mangrovi TaxID=3082379 RepID=A0ABU6A4V0_9PSEU|nr:polysaccharide biosynthesis protein [Saccharopolyspora sp. S2-29]MEB3366467.1 polysaccharide biosynthesis protein [Saccharopolyspora sp. S2-29]
MWQRSDGNESSGVAEPTVHETLTLSGLLDRWEVRADQPPPEQDSSAVGSDMEFVDLLGRSPVRIDMAEVLHTLVGKRVLVTGAGGSIGSELCRHISRLGPGELMMLDRDESALHTVQLALHGRALLDSPEIILADIRDQQYLMKIFAERRPQVVFHAAALKHLPILQRYPGEAWKSNVIGTQNVLRAAENTGVERFVNISTDKAANPTSALGYSKRIAERLTAEVAQRVDGTYVSVRFGNVLGSRGSVLGAFLDQISSGGPVTVTHPDVTRFFMTVSEAVQLVIYAAAIGGPGEALVLDMGQPVRIDDLARRLIRRSGRPIEVVYTGLRPGEKLHEALFDGSERDFRPLQPSIAHVTMPGLELADPREADVRSPDELMNLLSELATCVTQPM